MFLALHSVYDSRLMMQHRGGLFFSHRYDRVRRLRQCRVCTSARVSCLFKFTTTSMEINSSTDRYVQNRYSDDNDYVGDDA